MANVQMPPRQKLINMMYLVLTAMLAMNVSKEVLDAFAVMDNELVRSERAHEQRSKVEYAVFADAAQRFPDKFKVPHEKALAVKQHADSLVDHIEGIKSLAISEADGVKQADLFGTDGTGLDTLRSLLLLDAKDDRETLTRMLVGSEPADPKKDVGSAYELKERIASFREELKTLTGSKGTELASALDVLFDFSDRRDASGTMNNWESINFYDVPLAAGVATLSKLQADIRSAENDMVKWLYRSAEMDDYRFGTLTTAVIPESNSIMLGDSFRADVFLAAYDPRNAPVVTLKEEGSLLPIGADGKAKLRLRSDRIGEQIVEGTIRFEGPHGEEEFPYSAKFQVMAPLLVASPIKMNVLYRGVENPIDLSVPGVPADRIRPAISTGRITRGASGWVATGMAGNSAEVFAVVDQVDGSTRRIGPVEFRVKDLPPPTAFVAGKSARETQVLRVDLTAAKGVAARLDDSEWDDPWKVHHFKLSIVRRGAPVLEFSTNDNEFTAEMRTALSALRPNDRVYFEEIKARLANGQGRSRELAPIGLKVVR